MYIGLLFQHTTVIWFDYGMNYSYYKACDDVSPCLVSMASDLRGNRLSNATCLTHVFFKRGE